ncbi:LysR family transcriptional regulator [Tropicimonas sp. IMCC34011]|uniref:LysR family transcriptional regulator n=1 Tax=Tropicimonas sp. IMCC34011 TaxID=2248759 RepID=UPI000E280347|nr:LysR family transcriptional regulator [Tropicimonas sp. IMCC34011]
MRGGSEKGGADHGGRDAAGRITLWGIEVFAAVAEEGSLTAAARRLGTSPSGVSQQLASLEAAIGQPLIDRARRPVAVTPAGAAFRRRAQRILNEAAQARAELAVPGLAHLTDLRLGMIEDLEAEVTPRLLAGIADELTHCQFLLETGASHRLFDLLESRALDVIVAAELGAPADWMEMHPLIEEPFVVAAPKGSVPDGGDALAALKALPLILYTQRHLMGRQIGAHLARQNLTLAHRFELDSYTAIMALVAAGAGWTILTPLGLMRTRRFAPDVDVLPLPFPPLSRRISLHARAEVLQDMPERLAARLRGLLGDLIVAPALSRMPWLGEELRILGDQPAMTSPAATTSAREI